MKPSAWKAPEPTTVFSAIAFHSRTPSTLPAISSKRAIASVVPMNPELGVARKVLAYASMRTIAASRTHVIPRLMSHLHSSVLLPARSEMTQRPRDANRAGDAASGLTLTLTTKVIGTSLPTRPSAWAKLIASSITDNSPKQGIRDMGKSDLLRVQDVRDAYRLIGECR